MRPVTPSISTWSSVAKSSPTTPTPQALLVASIFFDFRAVHGQLDVTPLRAVIGVLFTGATLALVVGVMLVPPSAPGQLAVAEFVDVFHAADSVAATRQA